MYTALGPNLIRFHSSGQRQLATAYTSMIECKWIVIILLSLPVGG